MAIEAFNAFRAEVEKDVALQEACREALASGKPELIVSLGSERGFEFSGAEAEAVINESELSDLELELVAGGLPLDCGNGNTRK